jgi:hypothetical protein
MLTQDHGGGCCGITHLWSFAVDPNTRWNQGHGTYLDRLDAKIAEHNELRGGHRILEVVLNDNQYPNWHDRLVDRGFVMVTEFRNSNSGHVCRIYHYYSGDGGRFVCTHPETQIVPEIEFRDAPRPERREVGREFYAHLRHGGRRGPFLNEREARTAYPRCQRFEMRTFYSDGTHRWSDL